MPEDRDGRSLWEVLLSWEHSPLLFIFACKGRRHSCRGSLFFDLHIHTHGLHLADGIIHRYHRLPGVVLLGFFVRTDGIALMGDLVDQFLDLLGHILILTDVVTEASLHSNSTRRPSK